MNLKKLLKDINNIAIVGASSNPSRDSFQVMKFLMNNGYKVFPVNPKEKNILGQKCYASLKDIEEKIDMVDIFRAKEFIYEITNEAIEIDANIIWTQEGIVDDNAASLGIRSGLKVVMNECPKKILES